MLKNLRKKITLALSIMMVSSVPVFANDTFSILLDGQNTNVTVINIKDTGLTIEELMALVGDGNVTVLENSEDLESLLATQTNEPISKSKITLQNRKLTDDELKAWIEDYEERGGANEFELEVVRLVNIERAKENLPALEINEALMKAARFKSQEMLDLDYFDHDSPVYGVGFADGSAIFIARDLFKSTTSNGSENIGKGQKTPEQVVNEWMNSTGHRRAIMDKDHKTVGVGFVLNGNKLWTMNFGI